MLMTDLISRQELKAKLDRGGSFVLVDTLPESAYPPKFWKFCGRLTHLR